MAPALHERVESARVFAGWLSDAVGFRDRYAVQQALRVAARNREFLWGAVVDANGVVLAHSDLSQVDSVWTAPAGRVLAETEGARAVATEDRAGRSAVSIQATLTAADGKPAGTLVLVYSEPSLAAAGTSTALWTVLLSLVAAVGLGSLSLLWPARRVPASGGRTRRR